MVCNSYLSSTAHNYVLSLFLFLLSSPSSIVREFLEKNFSKVILEQKKAMIGSPSMKKLQLFREDTVFIKVLARVSLSLIDLSDC
ncbi:uncharacterized protein LOC107863293 isoform X2 [Capsicum annuum]|uniref:uncharacterized protein LOC107863293 isoform X2 n=1 Tax=Capsicum annuum TaxID=4072 RepID=UPI001FB1609E|nr:uncharacterized protein LOC107863293 isoform X2 [Capsicum annuum]